jgi:methionyl-tRNA formyltransferase
VSVVVAYGHILRREVLDVPKQGSINVHASLLPALRGAAPISRAIVEGHEETGVTIMRMVEAMDAGPIILAVQEPILPDETASELTVRLAEVGAAALVEALAVLSVGRATEVGQDHDAATYAPKVDRETARIDWTRSAREVANLVRGMDDVPGAWSTLRGAPVKLFRPTVASEERLPEPPDPTANGGQPAAREPALPGTVLDAHVDRGVVVATADGAVRFGEVQPPGKRRMSVADWVNGRGVHTGQRFA